MVDGKELGLSLKEEVGDTLGTYDSPTVGFNDGAEGGSLLGEALLLPSEDGRELGKTNSSTDDVSGTIFDQKTAGSWERPTAPLTANQKRYSMWDHLRAQSWDIH